MVTPVGIAALAAAAASFPTGFGFGAGYGAGVRIGYDVIYPKIAPFARQITDDILAAVDNLFGTSNAVQSGGLSGFDFAATPSSGLPTVATEETQATGRARQIADPCEGIQSRARSLQQQVLKHHARWQQLRILKGNQSNNVRAQQTTSNQMSQAKKLRANVTEELNALLNNPNNRHCVEGMSFT